MMINKFVVQMDEVLKNSYQDYHAKGLDYLCLKRTPKETIKLYFFDGDVSKLPEVVNPHNHRYDFDTTVIAGEMVDFAYASVPMLHEWCDCYVQYEYRTPLNGGNGFSNPKPSFLTTVSMTRLYSNDSAGGFLISRHDKIHTIRILEDRTILMLTQQEDLLPTDQPTSTFVPLGQPEPSLTGLYDRMTADRAMQHLRSLVQLRNFDITVE
jgi:hypothetical protein